MSKRPRTSLLACVAAIGALTIAACGDDGGDAAGDDVSAAGDADESSGAAAGTLVIEDFSFAPVSAGPGETVAVENRDDSPHTATAPDGAFDSGTVDPGGPGSFTAPAEPGTYEFNCTIHPEMNGTLTVGDDGADAGDGGADAGDGAGAGAGAGTDDTVDTGDTESGGGGYGS